MNKGLIRIIWRIFLIAIAALLAWKIVTVNMADHMLKRAHQGDEPALDLALAWDEDHPQAQAMHGARLLKSGRAEEAEQYLVSAVTGNPADALPLMLLANMRRDEGKLDISDEMVETADRLRPVDPKIQGMIAAHWYQRGQLDRAMVHLSRVLTTDSSMRKEMYPIVLRIAENPESRKTLAPIAEEPPIWWDSFFNYAMRNARSIDSLRSIVAMRKNSGAPISAYERNAYINRLKKDGQIAEAYLLWVNGLDKHQRESLAYLYDGNFELEFSNSGFGWYANAPKKSGIVVSRGKTYDISGERALFLSFRGKRFRFNHLRQSLFLNPGNYQLTGRVRVDKLQARKGLQWVVTCISGGQGTLGESEHFKGAGDWIEFHFDLQVPEGCEGQLIQLRSVGQREVDHELRGEIWFDDMRIRREP